MDRVLLAAAVMVTLPVAACGGTNDARLQSPAVGDVVWTTSGFVDSVPDD